MQEQAQPVAIVTGSSKGIGLGIATALATNGVRVVVTSRDRERAEATAQALCNAGGIAAAACFEIGREADLESLIAVALERFGRLDILVNNALDQSCAVPFAEPANDGVISTITHNLSHTYLLSCKAYPHLRQHRGCVLNIGSVVANRHLLGVPLYGIIKGAQIQMTKVLAAEWATSGVRVNAINPGFIRTQGFADMGLPADVIERAYAFYGGYQPLAGAGQPRDIGQAALFLTGPSAGLITGAVLEVDAGYSVQALPLYNGE